jgi:RNA polymerase sigma-70 factor (ECF subfamily)
MKTSPIPDVPPIAECSLMWTADCPSVSMFGLLLVELALGEGADDPSLAARIRESDREAFRRFYERHHETLFRYLRRRGAATDVAEDLVQKAFLYVWEHRQRIDPEQSLRGYLFRIGYTRMLNHRRDAPPHDAAAAPEDQSASVPSPAAEAAYRDLEEALEAAIKRLPERRRAVFELCFVEDLTYREAAEALDISPKTVENQMHRAFKALREALDAYRTRES